ncbi:hypothetical protein ABES25_04680 [Bacillus gobiensis]|uniref:hypothetical protein n=1 Tax=Bacillus gobiensis TaxID=1441095 RepID=UPI003D241C97
MIRRISESNAATIAGICGATIAFGIQNGHAPTTVRRELKRYKGVNNGRTRRY